MKKDAKFCQINYHREGSDIFTGEDTQIIRYVWVLSSSTAKRHEILSSQTVAQST